MPRARKPPDPDALVALILEALRREVPDAREGRVRTRHPQRYRRLDCDGRALAFLRPRSQAAAGLRVDLTGLWVRPGPWPTEIPGRSGSASLLVQTTREARAAGKFLAWAVRWTRSRLAQERRGGRPSIGV